MKNKNNTRGATLIDILTAVALIGLVMALITPHIPIKTSSTKQDTELEPPKEEVLVICIPDLARFYVKKSDIIEMHGGYVSFKTEEGNIIEHLGQYTVIREHR